LEILGLAEYPKSNPYQYLKFSPTLMIRALGINLTLAPLGSILTQALLSIISVSKIFFVSNLPITPLSPHGTKEII
jgi:hypothetical protein